MGLYRIQEGSLTPVGTSRFADDDIKERQDLQRMLREAIEIIVPGAMVLAEEFSDWEDSKRRVDLLCLDEDANLVVVELKRTESGGHMDLQSIRYAAMVAAMTFDRAVHAHERYLASIGADDIAEERLLEFLGWDEPREDEFARDVRIVLVSADFSTEITTAVLWLIDRGLDIRCVRMFPYRLDDEVLISVEQLIPLPSAEKYQVRSQEKSIGIRRSRMGGGGFTGYWFVNVGEHNGPGNHRSWDDARKHGFISAGGKSVRQLAELQPGDRFFAYRSGHGYVGAGVVTSSATPRDDFIAQNEGEPSTEQQASEAENSAHETPARGEHCIGVRWVRTVDRERAIKAAFRRPTACKIRDAALVSDLMAGFGLSEDDWAG